MITPEKKWFKVTHSPSGTTVSVTLQAVNLTSKWTVKVYEGVPGAIGKGVAEAEERALDALRQVADAINEATS